jgi:hypothetical protein
MSYVCSFPVILGLFFLTPAALRFGVEGYYYSALISIFSVCYLLLKKRKLNKFDITLLISFISFVFTVFVNFLLFDFISLPEFFSSFINLISMSFITVALITYTLRLPIDSRVYMIDGLLYFIVFIGLLKYLLFTLGVVEPEELDFYRRYDKFPIVIRSFFNEPSHYSIVIFLLISIKHLLLNIRFSSQLKFNMLILISLILTGSMTAYVLLIIYFYFYLFNCKYYGYLLAFSIIGSVVGIFVFYLFYLYFPDSIFIERAINVVSGDDGSANYRLIDTWAFLNAYNDNILAFIFGVSLGNMESYSISMLGFQDGYVGVNLIANILFVGGITYCFIFFFQVYMSFNGFALPFLFFLIISFTHGYIVGPFFLPLLGIAYGCSKTDILCRSNVISKYGRVR